MHGGRIWFKSEGRGKGTCFTFTIPRREPLAPVEDIKYLKNFIRKDADENSILLVDDNARNRRLFHDILVRLGYDIFLATNGREAVEMAKNLQPTLILMDTEMPVMDGIEATRAIRACEETKDIPVIALTSYVMKSDKDKILACGCNDFITKPVDIQLLLKR